MRKVYIILYIMMVILLSSFVTAAPPTDIDFNEQGLTLAVNDVTYLEQNSYNAFRVFVYNSTAGNRVEDTTCRFRLFHRNGSRVYNITDVGLSDCSKFKVAKLEPGNFSQIGKYTYSFCCEDNIHDYDGYITGSFEVTEDGTEPDNFKNIGLVIAAGIMAFLFLWFSFSLDSDHFLLKLLCLFFFMYSLMIMPSVMNSGDALFRVIKIPIYFFRVFIFYFAGYLFWHWSKSSQKMMELLENMKGGFKK